MKDMEKMLMAKDNKQDGKMSPEDMQAKMDVLHELLQMAHEAMGGKVKHGMDEMQKVSVMAPDKQSLEKGLDKAKEIAASGHMGMLEPDDVTGNHEDDESESDEEKSEPLLGDKSKNPDEESDKEGSAEEESHESPQEEAKEEEEMGLFSKKPSKEMPKKKKLFSMED